MRILTSSRQVKLNRHIWPYLLVILLALNTSFIQHASAQSFVGDAISFTAQPTGSGATTTQYAGSAIVAPYDTYASLGSSTPSITAPDLGRYDLNNKSSLKLTNPSIEIERSKLNPVSSAQVFYRVYLANTPIAQLPGFSQINLPNSVVDPNDATLTIYSADNINNELLTGLVSGGNYKIDIYFQVTKTKDGKYVTDPSDSYTATFSVTPPSVTPPGGTTTWVSIARGVVNGGSATVLPSDQDWLDPNNWSNGVPTYQSDAIIPEKSNAQIVYPILNSSTAPYEVRNLTLYGAQGETASKVTIGAATLRLYGNFSQESDPGLVGNTTGNSGVTDQIQNSTLILAGTDQTLQGNILISDLVIAGSGTKSIVNTPISISNIVSFQPASVTNGVVIQSALQRTSNGPVETIFSTNGRAYIQLLSTAQISSVVGQAETNVSYIKGVSRADRALNSTDNGRQSNFGNIGLEVNANHDINNLIVYRIVGSTLLGPTGGTAIPIKRQYELSGDDNSSNAPTAGSTVDVVFHYLDSSSNTSANELNGIDENNLTMYRTVDNGPPYRELGGTVNTVANTVTRTGIPSLFDYKITLGDKTNPLPVSLISFTATRSNQNALLTWATATEQNNAGFEVQVSTDGATFRKLAFVASQGPNSSQKLAYNYTDGEAGKTGTRYYRLRQIDITGESSFSPVRAVAFDGVAGIVALSAYPNPFVDKVDFNLDATTLGANGVARVQLLDMTGRIVREQNLSVQNASLTLDNLSSLRSGLYMARLTLPDGSTKTMRVQKQ